MCLKNRSLRYSGNMRYARADTLRSGNRIEIAVPYGLGLEVEMATKESAQFWFPARRYGWGWGLPNQWQGWVVYIVYTALLIAGVLLLDPRQNVAAVLLYTAAISAVLFGICWVKGERPRWRWGNSDA